MSGKRVIAWLALAGALALLHCDPALAEQQQDNTQIVSNFLESIKQFFLAIADFLGRQLKPLPEKIAKAAVGAVFGLIGLLIQLALRAEWPTGRLNEGSPKMLDPGRLVMAVLMAIAAGVVAYAAFPLLPPKAKPEEVIKNALAIVAFGYLAADLGFDQMKSLWEKTKSVFKSLADSFKGSRG
jgi:hypothetical protein